MNDTDVRQAYSDHLQEYPWDFYSTVTFRRLRRDPIYAASSVWGMLEKLGGSRAFVAVERHKLDGVHVHTLHRHTHRPDVAAASVWKFAHKAFGRSTVEFPRDGTAASVYCSKYVTKGDESGDSFFYFGEPEAWNLDK